jgi:hypothetical protein
MAKIDSATADRLARALIAAQGQQAIPVVDRVVRNLQQTGDYVGAERWRAVLAAIKRLIQAVVLVAGNLLLATMPDLPIV